ncbi:MAG: hypothetical protein R3Y56_05625 [Akkermansia sp.]
MKKPLLILALILAPMSLAQTDNDRPSRAQNGQRNPEMRQNMKAKMLEKFDTDGDGELSDDERSQAKSARENRSGGQAGGAQGKNGFGGAKGKNGAGKKQGITKEMLRKRILDKFDADSDGKLNEDERAKAKAAHEQRLQKYDTNGDGKIDKEERKELMSERRNNKQN